MYAQILSHQSTLYTMYHNRHHNCADCMYVQGENVWPCLKVNDHIAGDMYCLLDTVGISTCQAASLVDFWLCIRAGCVCIHTECIYRNYAHCTPFRMDD
jgi:hypothetical protein